MGEVLCRERDPATKAHQAAIHVLNAFGRLAPERIQQVSGGASSAAPSAPTSMGSGATSIGSLSA